MVILANLIAIFRKEFLGYFTSPFAYVIAAVFWLIAGAFFGLVLDNIIQNAELTRQAGITTPMDVPSEFLSGYLGVIISLILVLLPALSMGLYAEERKRGTLELLATSPLTNWVVALGKLLGVLAFFSVMMFPLWVYQLIIFSASNPAFPFSLVLCANIAVLAVAAAVLSLGMFISSLTESSIIAYILTFVLVLFLWIMDVFGQRLGGIPGEFLSSLSLFQHYNDLVNGVIKSQSLILLASYIFLGIFLTAQSIEALRFQRS
ncbi:ABC transporter permease [Synechocystis sp. LKSZ1]|uniref:ABC transporter permease n=1 Tax=Synechocystis sp. LKSZ1 TaxID=3144951 RepID=UPI00336C16AB